MHKTKKIIPFFGFCVTIETVIYMECFSFNDLFTADFNIDSIVSVAQTWLNDTQFNYMEKPRRSLGLLLITDHPAAFDLRNGQQLTAKPGDVILLPKGSHYLIRFLLPPGKAAHPLLINFRLSMPDGQELTFSDNIQCLCRDDGSLLPLFSDTVQLYKTSTAANLKAKVYELLGNILTITESDECCIRYINQNYTNQFSIPQLAKRCGLSETAYRKHFKKITGSSPLQYINSLKIDKACQMLQSGDISTKDICEFLNFYSLPYFYKVFKEHKGVTPSQYRNTHMQNSNTPSP